MQRASLPWRAPYGAHARAMKGTEGHEGRAIVVVHLAFLVVWRTELREPETVGRDVSEGAVLGLSTSDAIPRPTLVPFFSSSHFEPSERSVVCFHACIPLGPFLPRVHASILHLPGVHGVRSSSMQVCLPFRLG